MRPYLLSDRRKRRVSFWFSNALHSKFRVLPNFQWKNGNCWIRMKLYTLFFLRELEISLIQPMPTPTILKFVMSGLYLILLLAPILYFVNITAFYYGIGQILIEKLVTIRISSGKNVHILVLIHLQAPFNQISPCNQPKWIFPASLQCKAV